MSTLKHLIRGIWCVTGLLIGLVSYVFGRKTPAFAYHSLVRLFCRNGGKSNDWLSRCISVAHPPYQLEHRSGVLGNLDGQTLDRVVERLNEEGYYIFEQRLPDELSERLLNFALSQRCIVRPMDGHRLDGFPKNVDRYNRENPEGVRYDFSTQDVIDNPDVQQLMADSSIIAVAQQYLRCKPIFDVMSMWWHTAYSKVPDKEAAQWWHFDMDRIKWLKFFICLTDVEPDNGPHSFVKGSHRTGGIPSVLRLKGYSRLTDQAVEACFPPDKFIEFVAPRGTIIAEDTRGLHKGKLVLSGDRLLLQLQFSNSLFGGYYPPSKFSSMSHELGEMVRRYPHVYANYV